MTTNNSLNFEDDTKLNNIINNIILYLYTQKLTYQQICYISSNISNLNNIPDIQNAFNDIEENEIQNFEIKSIWKTQ